MSTVHERLKEVGVKIDSHASDLYVENTVTARLILLDYEFIENITRFRSPIDGKIWLEVPFANDDWWKARKDQSK